MYDHFFEENLESVETTTNMLTQSKLVEDSRGKFGDKILLTRHIFLLIKIIKY